MKFTQGHQCEDVDADFDLYCNFISSDFFFFSGRLKHVDCQAISKKEHTELV